MLKFILPVIFLIKFKEDWKVVQIGVFFIRFIVGVRCYHNLYVYNLGFSTGIDYIRYIMIYLRVWIISLILLIRQKVKNLGNFHGRFLFTNLCLVLALILRFSSIDYLIFYIRFEASLIPTLILILGWGYQPERIQAGIYMLFYTLTFSLPLLGSLLLFYYYRGSLRIRLREGVLHSNYTYKL